MGLAAAAGIGAVASIGGSLISSHAQTSAANKAADTQMKMYQQTRSDLAPFMSGGSQAFSNLANIFGFAPQASGTSATTGAAGGLPGAAGSAMGGAFGSLTQNMLSAANPGVTVPGIAGSSPLNMSVQNGQLAPASAGAGSPLAAGTSGGPNAGAAWQALTQFPGYQFGLDQGVEALDRSAASRGLLLSGAQLKDAQKFGANYAAQQAWQPYVSELNWASNLGENAAAGVGQAGANAAANAGQAQYAAGQSTAAGINGAVNGFQNGISQLASSYGNIGGLSGAGAGTGGQSFDLGYGPDSSSGLGAIY